MVHEVYLLRVYCSAKSYYVPLVNLCLCKRMLDQLQLFEIFYQVNSYHTQIFAGSNTFKTIWLVVNTFITFLLKRVAWASTNVKY